MDTQIRKGLIEFCVLTVLHKKDSYGYQMIKDLSDYIEISESTLYPLLRRLEIAGYLTTYTEEYKNRLRKYFQITKKGKEYLYSFKKEKIQIIEILNFIESEGEQDDR